MHSQLEFAHALSQHERKQRVAPRSTRHVMDTIKSALGYGQPSGEEPVSGQLGAGTADQPFDAGNAHDGAPVTAPTSPVSTTSATAAAALAASETQSGTEPISGVRGHGSALSPYDAGNSDDKQLGGQPPQLASSAPNVAGAVDPDPAQDKILGSTSIKPLDSTTAADATAAEDKVIDTANINPLKPEADGPVKSASADEAVETVAIKPLAPNSSNIPSTTTAAESSSPKVENKLGSSPDSDKPLPATPSKTTTADSTLSATPQIEGSNTPGPTGSSSKREKLREKFGSIKARFSPSPKA